MRLLLALLGSHIWAGLLEALWLGVVTAPAGEWSMLSGVVEAYRIQDVDGIGGVILGIGKGMLTFLEKLTIWRYAYLTGVTGLILQGSLIVGSIVATATGIQGLLKGRF